jgi:hypothetical protein
MTQNEEKAMLARPVPGLAAFLQAHLQASLQMALQKLRSIRFANNRHLACRPTAEVGWAQSAFWSSGAFRGARGAMGLWNPVQAGL